MLLNAGQVLTERAKIAPHVEAVVDTASGTRMSFRELNERANQTANTLLGLDFSPGERIACLMSNQTQYVESFYACAKAGFVFVALNWRLTVPELSYQLNRCGSSFRMSAGCWRMKAPTRRPWTALRRSSRPSAPRAKTRCS